MSDRTNKELLELLASLQIQGAVAEMERQVDAKEVDARFLAQVTAMLKHHEVKADIKEVSDLNEMREKAKKANQAILDRVRGDDEHEYVN